MHKFADSEVLWDSNLRTNLRLWPEPTDNVRALASCIGQPWNENHFLSAFPSSSGGKAPTDTRAVRNTFEVMAHAGLVYRNAHTNRLEATRLGQYVLTFLGVLEGHSFANENNRNLICGPIIAALSLNPSIRAIWVLMRLCDNVLTNEELNRAMARIAKLADVPEAAAAIRESRVRRDPTIIGERAYEPAAYGTARQSDQRKAMNPHFLLAGGGGLFIALSNPRRLEEFALPLVDLRLREEPPELLQPSTEATVVQAQDAFGAAPEDLRRKA